MQGIEAMQRFWLTQAIPRWQCFRLLKHSVIEHGDKEARSAIARICIHLTIEAPDAKVNHARVYVRINPPDLVHCGRYLDAGNLGKQ